VLFTSIVQIHGLSHNMGICGSAKNEFAARIGVTGNYLKRLMLILWSFAGLIAIAMFGADGLSDPAAVWGAMSKELLGPGLIGLMLAGVIAGTMSTLAAKALAISSLFVRNVYRQIWPDLNQKRGVFFARLTIVAVLILGALSAKMMHNVEDIVKLVLTVNVPFGAAVILMFFWRRLTAAAVWWSVGLSVLAIIVAPNLPEHIDALRRQPALVVQTVKYPALIQAPVMASSPAEQASIDRQMADARQVVPVFWKQTLRINSNDPTSPLEGTGRFNAEAWFLSLVGFDAAGKTSSGRETAQFLFDGFFPFVVLVLVSHLTRPTDPSRVDQFYGKMKTPVGATPELEGAAMEETRLNPHRFDHTKLIRASSWEFCKWDRVDTIGFFVCCALSAGIVGLFVLALHAVS
jgi:solute:Na+ symporter, SSS family